jgi:hypothetical protein
VYFILHFVCLQRGYDACRIYDLNYTSDEIRDVAERNNTVACQNWEYSRNMFTENIVTEVSAKISYVEGKVIQKVPES